MQDLQIVNDGALLIRNGIIHESGPTQRIENLQKARDAKEIDALGKVVMPAFVDPDGVLVSPPTQISKTGGETKEIPLRALSKKRLEDAAWAAAAAWARCGSLSVGAHSGYAEDLRSTVKILRIHQALQSKPLRIRSIFSPRQAVDAKLLMEKWLPAIRKRKLAPVLELTVGEEASLSLAELRAVATAAAGLGYSLRIRAVNPLEPEVHELAVESGAVAIVSPPCAAIDFVSRLAGGGCVQVLPAMAMALDGADYRSRIRECLGEGAAIALASGYQASGSSSCNPQYLLHLAIGRFGMTAEEAIVASTWNAACSLRMSHVTGSLEPGKSADLILMDVPDYRDLGRRPGHSDVLVAVRSGQVVYRRAGLILD